MHDEPSLFGDLLALARLRWVREMARRLEGQGFDDYRRSDAIALRWLVRGPMPLGELASTLDVTRQASRKVVDGLVSRGYALVERDRHDARRLNVQLTELGALYARAVIDTIEELNAQLDRRTDPYDMAVVKSVLRSVSTLYGND
ncbi:MAG: MarR family transcriptional regulator [Acidimicrobiales bacterium]